MRTIAAAVAILCLSTLVAAEEEAGPAHPLGCWAGLVGGEWHAKGAWEAGTPFAARLVAEWGPEKSFLRVKIHIPAGDGETVRSDSVYYRHPGTRKLAYLSAGDTGDVAAGTFEMTDDMVSFIYPGEDGDPRRLKSTWRFLTADECRWTVLREPPAGSAGPWKKLIEVDYHRRDEPAKKLLETKPPMPHRLAALSRFVGGRFTVTGQLGDGTLVSGAIEHSFGVTPQVMISKTFVTRGEVETLGFLGFTWWDVGAGVLRMIEFSAYGVFSEGTITVDRDTVVLAFRTWSKKGVKDYRQWTIFETRDRISWYVEEKTEAGWKPVTERMVGVRSREAGGGE